MEKFPVLAAFAGKTARLRIIVYHLLGIITKTFVENFELLFIINGLFDTC